MDLLTLFLLSAAAVVVAAGLWLWTPDKRRAVLERDYLRRPADMAEVDGTRLHLRDEGSSAGPPVILLHGFGASLHGWEPWAHALSRTCRVISLDLPGSGLSPPDPEGDYSDARALRLLLALLDQKGIAQTSVIGHSIGGRIAWRLAAEHPERLDKLVLIAPDGFASPGIAYGVAPKVPAMMSLMRHILPKPLLRMNLVQSYGDPASLTRASLDRYHDLMLAPGSRQALLDRMAQTVLTDPEPALERITAPVLLLWGEKDAMVPFDNAQDYLRHLPDARLVSFPELGHLPQEEAPEKTLPPVAEFLSAPGAGRPDSGIVDRQ